MSKNNLIIKKEVFILKKKFLRFTKQILPTSINIYYLLPNRGCIKFNRN